MDDVELTLKICQGHRPNFKEIVIPRLLKNLIRKCWDANPRKRPTTEEMNRTINSWLNEIKDKKNTEFHQQYQVLEIEYNFFAQNVSYQRYSTNMNSRLLQTNARLSSQPQEISSYLESLRIKTLNLNLEQNQEIEQVAQIIQQQPFPSSSQPK